MSRKQPNFSVQRFYGHDNRFVDDHNIRRVKFEQGGIRKVKDKVWAAIRNRGTWDEDMNMGGGGGEPNRRQFIYRGGHRRGRGPPRGGPEMREVRNVNMMRRGSWFQIKIFNGARYSRDEVLTRIAETTNKTFFPVCYQVMGNDSVFYVDNFPTAQMLLSFTRKIQYSDGQVMGIRIKDTRPPLPPIDDVLRGKMKNAMAKRFIAENKALDLSKFTRDPEFLDGVYCTLSRPSILSEVLKIITENIPDLHALNLTGNQIHDMDPASVHIKNMKSLRILHLSENNISNLNVLNCWKETEVSELVIEKNPVVNNFSDRTHFVRYGCGVTEVRKRFPKLCKLDNVEMAPLVAFDVEEDSKLPPAQAAFVCNAEGRGFVKAFLSQYFQIYDSDNRLELAQAYAENACFSLTCHYPPTIAPNSPRLNAYNSVMRNLLRVHDFPRRKQRLHTGKPAIVKILSELPKSQHDLLSFVVDLPFFSPELISLCVSGLFRERGVGNPKNWPLRYFSRTFLIVPMGTGFCIVNEVLNVTNATDEQIEVAFKEEPAKPVAAVTVSLPVAAVPVVATHVAPTTTPDDSVKLQMVHTISQQTGMNLDWSKKCLEETEWDFQRAAWTFTELQKRNSIPPEAFIK